jgi:phage anti-repressor protein
VNLIENNPVSKLTNTYQNRLLEKIKETFTTQEQQLFIASFYCYLNYKSNDFIIDLNNIWEWLGFSQKIKAKQILEKNFIKDNDYKIVYRKSAENLQGGRPKEHVLLTIKTFKKLCMKANTSKANEIHNYYVNLEEILFEVLEEQGTELQQEINDTKLKLEETESTLESTKQRLNKVLKKKYTTEERGDIVYLFTDNTEGRLKIGHTTNINKRESAHLTSASSGEVLYIKRCFDSKFSESVIHYRLRDFRELDKREWFNISKKLAIKIIDETIDFLESPVIYKKEKNETEYFEEEINDLDNDDTTEEIKIDVVSKSFELKNKPTDFTKFINEYCEINPEFTERIANIKLAYRFYIGIGVSKQLNKQLDDFLNKNFKKTIVFNDTGKNNSYKGLKLKPMKFTPNLENDYEKFISEKCSVDYNYRTSFTTFFDKFIEWKKESNPYYKLQDNYKNLIRKFLIKNFSIGRPTEKKINNENNSTTNYGVYGLGFEFNNFGMKEPTLNYKPLGEYDCETNELIQQWKSLTAAALSMDVNINTLADRTKTKRIIDNKYYKYIT